MPSTNVEIQNADATDKAIKLFDGRGLYLEVSPRGGRWWRLKYRFQGREKRLALGVYPEVSLKEARARCDDARITRCAQRVAPPAQLGRAPADRSARSQRSGLHHSNLRI